MGDAYPGGAGSGDRGRAGCQNPAQLDLVRTDHPFQLPDFMSAETDREKG